MAGEQVRITEVDIQVAHIHLMRHCCCSRGVHSICRLPYRLAYGGVRANEVVNLYLGLEVCLGVSGGLVSLFVG